MRRYIHLLLLLSCFQISNAQTFNGKAEAPASELALWYRKPATKWMSGALPIGNGIIGAMVYGGVEQEHLQYNDKTLWSGSTTKRGSYQNFGDLFLDFPKTNTVENYRRELDLNEAVSRVFYSIDGVRYTREYFCSFVDQVIVMRITSNAKGKINFSASIRDAHQDMKPAPSVKVDGNTIMQTGKLDILDFAAQLSVLNEGGTITSNNGKLIVKNANTAILILSMGTNYDPEAAGYIGDNPTLLKAKVSKRNKKALQTNYYKLYSNHIKDYRGLFDRVSFNLGQTKSLMPTDELLFSYMKSQYNPSLEVLYYQYGRYLMISSARGIALPSNLQGLWNNSNNPAWQADLHSDINVQMNYWPAEITNLSELHHTLTDYLYNEALVQPSWRKAAKDDGTEGWSQWVQNNIFGFGDWAKTRPANAWYCMHMWQHYIFTKDKRYLATQAYPVMKGACDYWLGRLVERDGKLVAPKEWSPEIGPWNVEGGVAYAQQLIWDLFNNTIEANILLNDDLKYRNKLAATFKRLDKGLKVGSWGQLMEWNNPEIETKHSGPRNTHRHLSHLIALYPGKQISPLLDTVYSQAAKKSLLARGDLSTGWALAWRLACWARLLDGNHAHKLLKNSLIHITSTEITYNEGGVYENLLNGPPFQIDGNFGITAGLTEMFVQSHFGKIQLLPAIPNVWLKGEISGLKAAGDFTVGIKWDANAKSFASIHSGKGTTCRIYFKGINNAIVKDSKGKTIRFDIVSSDEIVFLTVKNETYSISNLPFKLTHSTEQKL